MQGVIPRLTFAAWHGVVPHHVAVLEDARDGLRAVRFDEPLLTQEGDGTAQLKVLTETLSIHWHTWVRALVVTEGCEGTKVRSKSVMAERSEGMKSKRGSPTMLQKWRLLRIIYLRQLLSVNGF